MQKRESFNLGIEPIEKWVEESKVSITTGLQIFWGNNNVKFHGLQFSNIASVDTNDDMLEIKLNCDLTIKLRTDGWCVWE